MCKIHQKRNNFETQRQTTRNFTASLSELVHGRGQHGSEYAHAVSIVILHAGLAPVALSVRLYAANLVKFGPVVPEFRRLKCVLGLVSLRSLGVGAPLLPAPTLLTSIAQRSEILLTVKLSIASARLVRQVNVLPGYSAIVVALSGHQLPAGQSVSRDDRGSHAAS